MDARRARILVGSTLVMSVLAATSAGSVAAADCALTAPAYVNVGTPLTISGSGFPATSTVDIGLTIEGGASDAFPVQTNASGALQIDLTPEDIDIGVTTIQATAGSTCTAQVTYAVLAAGETPPTPEPVDAGAQPAPGVPRTDGESTIAGASSGSTAPWVLAFALLVVGGTGLFLTRSAKRP